MTTNQSENSDRSVQTILQMTAALSGVIVYTSANGFMTGGLAVAGREVGLSEVVIGFVLGIGAFIGVIAAPLWGYAAEIWSRRKLMLLAVPMVALGPAAMAVITAQSILISSVVAAAALTVARLVQAMFGAALIPVAQAYMADLTNPNHRIRGMGGLSAVISFGTLIGSVLLWGTGRHGVATGFAIVALLGVVATLLVFIFLPEAQSRTNLPVAERTLPLTRIAPYIAITLVGFTSYTVVPPILALRLMDKFGFAGGEAAATAGLILTVGVVAVCLAQVLIAARQNWNPSIMLRVGSASILGGLAMLLVADDVISMCIAMITIGFAVGFIAPANLGAISLHAGQGSQAKVAGLNMAARGLGSAIGPIIGTIMYKMDVDAPIYGSMILVSALLLLTVVVRTPSVTCSIRNANF
ncbi:putative MFS family arabinose efflux permease [Phyllobacterium bourgognense]|uniref:Putative MFS family arabinose efflux permease n=2 Tax=Phyllobacterium bourgognense TaxID=314236 RepID=A0A368YSK7_9HYPH|nr:putative MFS family arabinose efflux permease [Phyllobacterium bourgognense]